MGQVKEAADIAGLKCLRVMNDNTATALVRHQSTDCIYAYGCHAVYPQ
jgi:molecular chaperone DnaK (HSP70)